MPLGAFISENVYDGKLRSEHRIHNMDCVAFVDAAKGQEEKCGTSWRVGDVPFPRIDRVLIFTPQNQNEIQTIVHLVRHYYQHKDFCVITPYDAQRAALEKQLKAEGLPWERVFNVDSFQGRYGPNFSSMVSPHIPARERNRICNHLCCAHNRTWISIFTEQSECHAHTV